MFQLVVVACQPRAPCQARNVSTTAGPVRRGTWTGRPKALAVVSSERSHDHTGPDGYGFRVYADPVGHPFCLCRNKGVVWTDQGPVWPKRD